MGYRFAFAVAFLFSFSFGHAAHRAFDHAPLVTSSQIESWFKNPATEPKTIETFLAKLPEIYRGHFALMYDSKSLHQATPNEPRIIFFGPDARLLTAVSTDPRDPRYGVVEMIEYEPQTAEYKFHELDFDGERPQFIREPSRCNTCHGGDGRPNWEPYDGWPGAYGSVHDTMKWKTKENALFGEFMKTSLFKGRFLSLPPRFVTIQETFGGDPTYFTTSRGGGLNGGFSLLLGFSNLERVSRIMVESKNHARYRYAIAATLLNCKQPISSFLAPDLQSNHPRSFKGIFAETKKMILKDRARRIENIARLQEAKDKEELAQNIDRYGERSDEIVRVAKLRYLFENRIQDKIAMDRWSTSLYRDSYDFNDGVGGLENLIGHYVPMAFPDSDPLKKKMKYKTTLYDATSYSPTPVTSGHPEGFKLELFQAEPVDRAFCLELQAAGQRS